MPAYEQEDEEIRPGVPVVDQFTSALCSPQKGKKMGVTTVIKDYGTEILNAIRDNDVQRLKAILEKHLRVDKKIQKLCVADIKHKPTKKFACPLILAARQDDPKILKYMMDKGVDPNFVHHTIFSSKRREIVTALHIAVDLGLYDTVEVLLQANADCNIGDHNQETPLHIATKKADRIMTRMLLSKGANPAIPDRRGNAALHIATMYGHLQLVRSLLKYDADVYQKGQSGAIPPHIAAKEGHIHLIQLFCSRDVGNINIKIPCYPDQREKAPIHLAAEHGHVETVLALLDQFDAEVNLKDSEGNTPLHCVVLNQYNPHRMRDKEYFNESARVLLKYKVSINEKNIFGDTALHLAAMNQFQRIVELLLEVGANPFVENEENLKPIDVVPDSDPVTKQVLKSAMLNPRPLLSASMDTLKSDTLKKDLDLTPLPSPSSKKFPRESRLNRSADERRSNLSLASSVSMASVFDDPVKTQRYVQHQNAKNVIKASGDQKERAHKGSHRPSETQKDEKADKNMWSVQGKGETPSAGDEYKPTSDTVIYKQIDKSAKRAAKQHAIEKKTSTTTVTTVTTKTTDDQEIEEEHTYEDPHSPTDSHQRFQDTSAIVNQHHLNSKRPRAENQYMQMQVQQSKQGKWSQSSSKSADTSLLSPSTDSTGVGTHNQPASVTHRGIDAAPRSPSMVSKGVDASIRPPVMTNKSVDASEPAHSMTSRGVDASISTRNSNSQTSQEFDEAGELDSEHVYQNFGQVESTRSLSQHSSSSSQSNAQNMQFNGIPQGQGIKINTVPGKPGTIEVQYQQPNGAPITISFEGGQYVVNQTPGEEYDENEQYQITEGEQFGNTFHASEQYEEYPNEHSVSLNNTDIDMSQPSPQINDAQLAMINSAIKQKVVEVTDPSSAQTPTQNIKRAKPRVIIPGRNQQEPEEAMQYAKATDSFIMEGSESASPDNSPNASPKYKNFQQALAFAKAQEARNMDGHPGMVQGTLVSTPETDHWKVKPGQVTTIESNQGIKSSPRPSPRLRGRVTHVTSEPGSAYSSASHVATTVPSEREPTESEDDSDEDSSPENSLGTSPVLRKASEHPQQAHDLYYSITPDIDIQESYEQSLNKAGKPIPGARQAKPGTQRYQRGPGQQHRDGDLDDLVRANSFEEREEESGSKRLTKPKPKPKPRPEAYKKTEQDQEQVAFEQRSTNHSPETASQTGTSPNALNMRVTGEVPKAYNRASKDSARRKFMLAKPVGIESGSEASDTEMTGSRSSLNRMPSPGGPRSTWGEPMKPYYVKTSASPRSGTSPTLNKSISPISDATKPSGKSKLIGPTAKPYKSFGKIETRTDALENPVPPIAPFEVSDTGSESPPSEKPHYESAETEETITTKSEGVRLAEPVTPGEFIVTTIEPSGVSTINTTNVSRNYDSYPTEETGEAGITYPGTDTAESSTAKRTFKKNVGISEEGPECESAEHVTIEPVPGGIKKTITYKEKVIDEDGNVHIVTKIVTKTEINETEIIQEENNNEAESSEFDEEGELEAYGDEPRVIKPHPVKQHTFAAESREPPKTQQAPTMKKIHKPSTETCIDETQQAPTMKLIQKKPQKTPTETCIDDVMENVPNQSTEQTAVSGQRHRQALTDDLPPKQKYSQEPQQRRQPPPPPSKEEEEEPKKNLKGVDSSTIHSADVDEESAEDEEVAQISAAADEAKRAKEAKRQAKLAQQAQEAQEQALMMAAAEAQAQTTQVKQRQQGRRQQKQALGMGVPPQQRKAFPESQVEQPQHQDLPADVSFDDDPKGSPKKKGGFLSFSSMRKKKDKSKGSIDSLPTAVEGEMTSGAATPEKSRKKGLFSKKTSESSNAAIHSQVSEIWHETKSGEPLASAETSKVTIQEGKSGQMQAETHRPGHGIESTVMGQGDGSSLERQDTVVKKKGGFFNIGSKRKKKDKKKGDIEGGAVPYNDGSANQGKDGLQSGKDAKGGVVIVNQAAGQRQEPGSPMKKESGPGSPSKQSSQGKSLQKRPQNLGGDADLVSQMWAQQQGGPTSPRGAASAGVAPTQPTPEQAMPAGMEQAPDALGNMWGKQKQKQHPKKPQHQARPVETNIDDLMETQEGPSGQVHQKADQGFQDAALATIMASQQQQHKARSRQIPRDPSAASSQGARSDQGGMQQHGGVYTEHYAGEHVQPGSTHHPQQRRAQQGQHDDAQVLSQMWKARKDQEMEMQRLLQSVTDPSIVGPSNEAQSYGSDGAEPQGQHQVAPPLPSRPPVSQKPLKDHHKKRRPPPEIAGAQQEQVPTFEDAAMDAMAADLQQQSRHTTEPGAVHPGANQGAPQIHRPKPVYASSKKQAKQPVSMDDSQLAANLWAQRQADTAGHAITPEEAAAAQATHLDPANQTAGHAKPPTGKLLKEMTPQEAREYRRQKKRLGKGGVDVSMSDTEASTRKREKGKTVNFEPDIHSDAEVFDMQLPEMNEPGKSLQDAAFETIHAGLQSHHSGMPKRMVKPDPGVRYTTGTYRPQPHYWRGSKGPGTAGTGRYDDSLLVSQMWSKRNKSMTTESEGEADMEDMEGEPGDSVYFKDSPEHKGKGNKQTPEQGQKPLTSTPEDGDKAFKPISRDENARKAVRINASDNSLRPPGQRGRRGRRGRRKKDLPPGISEPVPVDFNEYGMTAQLWMEQVDKKTVKKSKTMAMMVMPEGMEPPEALKKSFPQEEIKTDDVFLPPQWVIARGRSWKHAKQDLLKGPSRTATVTSESEGEMGPERPMSPGRQKLLFFRVGSNWRELAWILFEGLLNDAERLRMIRDIQLKNPGELQDQVNDMIHRWWRKKGTGATIEELQHALDYLNMGYIEEEFFDQFGRNALTSFTDVEDDLDISEISDHDPEMSRLIGEYELKSLNSSFETNPRLSGMPPPTSSVSEANVNLARVANKLEPPSRIHIGSTSSAPSFGPHRLGSSSSAYSTRSMGQAGLDTSRDSIGRYRLASSHGSIGQPSNMSDFPTGLDDSSDRLSFVIVQPQLRPSDFRHETTI